MALKSLEDFKNWRKEIREMEWRKNAGRLSWKCEMESKMGRICQIWKIWFTMNNEEEQERQFEGLRFEMKFE